MTDKELVRLSAQAPRELVERLEAVAASNDRSVAAEIRRAVEAYVLEAENAPPMFSREWHDLKTRP